MSSPFHRAFFVAHKLDCAWNFVCFHATSSGLYASWSFQPLLVGRSSTSFHGNERAAAIWSSSRSIAGPLQRTLSKAQSMYDNQAFVHHYRKYGLEDDAFRERFADIAQVIRNYESIS
jgi:hypothetical protein